MRNKKTAKEKNVGGRKKIIIIIIIIIIRTKTIGLSSERLKDLIIIIIIKNQLFKEQLKVFPQVKIYFIIKILKINLKCQFL